MNSDFEKFVKEVQREVPRSIPSLIIQAQGILNANEINAKIVNMQLSGSFATGSKKKPTEDSDVDLLVTYEGDVNPEQLVSILAGKLYGEFGAYDVQAIKEHMINEKILPQQFIQEIFQEDGEGGMSGGAPAASISANPANLSTGSSSTLSKMAPEHMRFGVVTPFGNVSRKKKKTKKRKGWPY